MEPSFSTFLMLFPGYKLEENISYSKEGNALNECRRGILHKGGNQEPFGKNLSRSAAGVGRLVALEDFGTLSGEGQILSSVKAALPPKFPLHSMTRLPKQEPHP